MTNHGLKQKKSAGTNQSYICCVLELGNTTLKWTPKCNAGFSKDNQRSFTFDSRIENNDKKKAVVSMHIV